jgi:hypothetical protein
MKKVISMVAVLALVCFTTMVFAADTATPLANVAAAAKASVKTEAVKAANGEVIIGTIKKLDTKANTIAIEDKTINVKADEIRNLKEGEKVKVTLATGTMNAEKIMPLEKKAAKKAAKKEVKKAKDQAVQTATDKAVEKINQQ